MLRDGSPKDTYLVPVAITGSYVGDRRNGNRELAWEVCKFDMLAHKFLYICFELITVTLYMNHIRLYYSNGINCFWIVVAGNIWFCHWQYIKVPYSPVDLPSNSVAVSLCLLWHFTWPRSWLWSMELEQLLFDQKPWR